ncbi:hypothetical protein EYF80_002028 [Liparis tanakae]|uniref:Uncharacterized protein n=1 Tax=Liparis tanakae TaxID=230148 RepID=A0A4Z2JCD9_9TELE|nr:hypothetical protein EYF80_002028 [Liparis tanakae]
MSEPSSVPASELVSSTKASSSIKSDISLCRSSASSVISESVVEKVGEGVRSAKCSLTQPWKMGELSGLLYTNSIGLLQVDGVPPQLVTEGGLVGMVLLGVCGLALMVAGLVESLRVPPVAFRLLQRLHGAGGPLAVIERVAAASLVGLLVLLVLLVVAVPIVVPVTLA